VAEATTSTQVARGAFTCPACGRTGDYVLVRVARAGTEIGTYVECRECFCTFPRSVLWRAADGPLRANHLEACLRTMVLMMIVDEVVLDAEIDRITEVYPQVGGRDLTRDEVLAEVDRAREDAQALEPFLQGMAGRLNGQGKLAVIRSAYAIATADGVLHESERALLGALATALDIENPLDRARQTRQ